MAAIPTITDALVRRMAKDEDDVAAFFSTQLKGDKVRVGWGGGGQCWCWWRWWQ